MGAEASLNSRGSRLLPTSRDAGQRRCEERYTKEGRLSSINISRSSEMDRWLQQPQDQRGLSPDRQMRQPLGFRSKRQYRQESVNGYQDVSHLRAAAQLVEEDLLDVFQCESGERNFIVSADSKNLEKNFAELRRLEPSFPKINTTLYRGIEQNVD